MPQFLDLSGLFLCIRSVALLQTLACCYWCKLVKQFQTPILTLLLLQQGFTVTAPLAQALPTLPIHL